MSTHRYEVKELVQSIEKIRAFHVIYEGKPVGVLTNQCDHSNRASAHQDWRVFSLTNNKQHQPWWIDKRFTLSEAIKQLQLMEPDELIFGEGDSNNPDCIIKFYTAFGIVQYRGIDDHSGGYPYFTTKVDSGKHLPKNQAVELARNKGDLQNSSMHFTGDRVIKIEVVIRDTSEIVFTNELEQEPMRYKN